MNCTIGKKRFKRCVWFRFDCDISLGVLLYYSIVNAPKELPIWRSIFLSSISTVDDNTAYGFVSFILQGVIQAIISMDLNFYVSWLSPYINDNMAWNFYFCSVLTFVYKTNVFVRDVFETGEIYITAKVKSKRT